MLIGYLGDVNSDSSTGLPSPKPKISKQRLEGNTMFYTNVPEPAKDIPTMEKEEEMSVVTELQKHFEKSHLCVTRRLRRNTLWHVEDTNPLQEGEPQIKPLNLNKQGLLEVWHSRSYSVQWVVFDGMTLSIYQNEKEMFSEKVLLASSIKCVQSTKDKMFTVFFGNQKLDFQAGSERGRNEWVSGLKYASELRRDSTASFPSENEYLTNVQKKGKLQVKGLQSCSKVYMVVTDMKTWLYKNEADYKSGIAITAINMGIAKVKKMKKICFELTTPHNVIYFTTSSEGETDKWVATLTEAAEKTLSCSDVVERVWAVPENCQCADCGDSYPKWASVNFGVLICSKCAGEHRSLHPNISKVRSLTMDKKIWTESLIQFFIDVGNKGINAVLALNVPPSESIGPGSSSRDRQNFISSKYQDGKYRKIHPLFGLQGELNQALCRAVLQNGNISETLLLVFSGAQVACNTGDPRHPTPAALAEREGQLLQLEFLKQQSNQGSPVSGRSPWSASPRPPTSPDRIPSAEDGYFSCKVEDGKLFFYVGSSPTPSDSIDLSEITSVAAVIQGDKPAIELLTAREVLMCETELRKRLKDWVRYIAKSVLGNNVSDSDVEDFDRISKVKMKGTESSQWQDNWILLKKRELRFFLPSGREIVQLSNQLDITFIPDENVISIMDLGKLYCIQFDRSRHFNLWRAIVNDVMSHAEEEPHPVLKARAEKTAPVIQQETEGNRVPRPIEICLQFLTKHGLTVEGIYRKPGQLSKTTQLLEQLRKDPLRVRLEASNLGVHEVASTLKRYLREMHESVFDQRYISDWLKASEVQNLQEKFQCYQSLLELITPERKAILKALFIHLYCVHSYCHVNGMTTANLALVFAPTLFLVEKASSTMLTVVLDCITHYRRIFNVDDSELIQTLSKISI
ncbi:arf-GAP with Rho-GAP domain, ANK repeat and PH domain-containing protein 1-like [Latimeria chalumnae]|uniref:arf-GAP with Rho-GAP domain, ANK repeat and PH domain-containing protein 1-like n=1 Tax=Latimeria chalumnae TaxID=7897 RepID=UPI00313DEC26